MDNSQERISIKERFTKETNVRVRVNIDGFGKVEIKTGIPFIDHLISAFGKHSMVDIHLEAKSNDNISHHLIEDVAITLSQTLNEALSNRAQIKKTKNRLSYEKQVHVHHVISILNYHDKNSQGS